MGKGPVIEIDGTKITDMESFHDEFARTFGFPDFYGRNMDAWIDCFNYVDSDDGMRSLTIEPGEILTIHVRSFEAMNSASPQAVRALLECAAFVNHNSLESSGAPLLAIALD
ncbi:MAG: barstar family protein [Planctomycetota bacterium]